MANNNFPIDSLDQPTIANNLKSWLAGNPFYKDYNFAGSGISSLINFLSYNTSYIGFYVKMLLDESFVDSAHTVDALWAHAKRQGYIPRSNSSAHSEIILTVSMPISSDPPSQTVTIPAGSTLGSSNTNLDQRTFNVIDAVNITNRSVAGSTVTYTSDPFFVYEGSPQSFQFTVDNSQNNQTFVLPDPKIDSTTIRVSVSNGASTIPFVPVQDIFTVTPTSQVFYTTTAIGGQYQIFFGNNVFGMQPQNADTVTVTWLSSSADGGNGASSFLFNNGSLLGYTGASYSVTTISASAGGSVAETATELRFTIPNSWRRQNRLVTSSDYSSVILEKFPSVDSLNVWGGEENVIRQYGSVFISVKPKTSDTISTSLKDQITNEVLSQYGVVGQKILWVDPSFINVDVSLFGSVDMRETSDGLTTIESQLISNVSSYNTEYLNHFNSILSDITMLNQIVADHPEVTTIYSSKSLWIQVPILYKSSSTVTVVFSNPLVPYSVVSGSITYGSNVCTLSDDGNGGLWLMSAGSKVLSSPSGSVDYETGDVSFVLPTFATIPGFTGTIGSLVVRASPASPDVVTTQNNITRISAISCKLKALTQ